MSEAATPTVELQRDADRVRVLGDLTIYSVAELWQLLQRDVLGGQGTLFLDLEQVSEVDTAGVQLLLLIHRQLGASERMLNITCASQAVSQNLQLCGLEDWVAPTAGSALS